MELDHRTASLLAVAASVAANCQPCLEINVARALRYDADPQQIADAIEVGGMVRAGAAAKMDAFSGALDLSVLASADSSQKCGCC